MKEPVDKQSEYGVLAGMMNDTAAYYDAIGVVTSDFFTDDETIKLFDWLAEKGQSKSASSIIKNVKGAKEKALIRTIDGTFTNVENFKDDLENLKDTYLKRQLYHMMNNAYGRLENQRAEQIIGMMETEIGRMYFDDEDENIIDPEVRAQVGYERALDKYSNPESYKGVPFSVLVNGSTIGFPALDEVFNGAGGGDLIMLAARTGEGKTALGVNLARLFSLYQNYYGYYQNTEMRIDEMESRFLSPIAKASAKEIYYGRYEGTQDEIKVKLSGLAKAYEVFRKSKLFLSRIPSLPLHKSKGLAKQVRVRYGKLDYLIVDYVGRMDLADKGRSMQQWDVMYEITKQLKELAMELDIPVFMLAQRTQGGEVEGAKKMMNECDGVLYFEPCGEDDQDFIDQTFSNPEKRKAANYKIVKKKVRRDDTPYPIYCNFDKKMQFINEIPRG